MRAEVVAVVLRLLAGVVPVLLFLASLLLLDSWKLVTRRAVLRSIAWGMAVAAVAFAVNAALLSAGLDARVLRRYVAPVVEEMLKAALLAWMIRGGRVGFLVDAAIHGFAAGAGFALVENAYYAGSGVSGLALWVVRGLGTAVMHGSATAIAAILAKSLYDRLGGPMVRWLVPGIAAAALIHSLYNHLLLSPLLATAALIAVLPLLVVFVFDRSERATEAWIGEGLDSEVELLELIGSGEFRRTHAGAYLEALRQRFPGPVVADMLCWLQIRLELAVRAKGLLIARAAGVDLPVDPEVRANFAEMEFLEKSIGPTGKLALMPLTRGSARDLWQLRILAERG